MKVLCRVPSQAVATSPRQDGRILLAIAACAFVFCSVPARHTMARDSEKQIRLELRELATRPDSGDNPFKSVRTFVELESIQPNVDQGIMFDIIVSNEGSEAIELLDTTYYFGVELMNSEGLHVELPRTPTLSQVATSDPDGFRARWEPRKPVKVVVPDAAAGGSGVKTVRDFHGGEFTLQPGEQPRVPPRHHTESRGELTLEPGEQLRVTFQISKVLAKPREFFEALKKRMNEPRDSVAPWPTKDPEVAPIPKGGYQLSVRFMLAAPPPGGPIHSMRECKPVTVQLGENP